MSKLLKKVYMLLAILQGQVLFSIYRDRRKRTNSLRLINVDFSKVTERFMLDTIDLIKHILTIDNIMFWIIITVVLSYIFIKLIKNKSYIFINALT